MQDVGALFFGMVVGWFAYYVNRYRSDTISVTDVATFLGAIGGAAVLTLFPAGSAMFGYYGLGLALGFFGYFAVLVVLVRKSKGFTAAFFLDGRAPALEAGDVHDIQRPMLRAPSTSDDEHSPSMHSQ